MDLKNLSNEDFACTILEVNYIKALGRDPNAGLEENDDLFPMEWVIHEDIYKKMKILKEAIEKKCRITDTDGFLDIIEKVIVDSSEKEEDR